MCVIHRTARFNQPVSFPFHYNGSISYLEHVVITMSLTVGGDNIPQLSEENASMIVTTDTLEGRNTGNEDYYQARVKRGDISATLTSPNRTTSTVLFQRPWDITSAEGYNNWPFLSVLHWGENPVGTWILNVSFSNSQSNSFARVSNVTVDLYGVGETPVSVREIPSLCDSNCARGCSGNGTENCDACGNGLVRNATTLECIQLQDCTPPNTIASGYCFVPSSAMPSAVQHVSAILLVALTAVVVK